MPKSLKENTKLTDEYAETSVKKAIERQKDDLKKLNDEYKQSKSLLEKLKAKKALKKKQKEESESEEEEEEKPKKKSSKKKGKGLDSDILEYLKQF